jgi:hypothetical protein
MLLASLAPHRHESVKVWMLDLIGTAVPVAKHSGSHSDLKNYIPYETVGYITRSFVMFDTVLLSRSLTVTFAVRKL